MSPTEPYRTDHDPPTLTFCSGGAILALPYHLLRALHLQEAGILLEYSDYEVTILGTALGKLWKELRAYRVKEITVTQATTVVPGGDAVRCCVKEIRVEKREDEGSGA